ncbi:MAG: hypothetical protein ABI310_09095, partial [Microbacteriaceae bacterium]
VHRPPAVRWDDGTAILVTRMPAARIRSLRAYATAPLGNAIDVVDIDAVNIGIGEVGIGDVGIGDVGAGAVAAGEQRAGRLDDSGGHLRVLGGSERARGQVLVGSPDSWQARWGLFAALRGRSTVVFDGCSVAQLRSLLQTREVPPLIAGPDRAWSCTPDGTIRRARWVHDES